MICFELVFLCYKFIVVINQARYIINAVLLLFLIFFIVFVVEKFFTIKTIERNNSTIIDYTNSETFAALSIGKSLFSQRCASCHSIMKDLIGPALNGLEGRGPWKDRKKLYEWINNPSKFMAKNNYVKTLKEKFQAMMTAFPDLKEKEIDAIVDYINSSAQQKPTPVALKQKLAVNFFTLHPFPIIN